MSHWDPAGASVDEALYALQLQSIEEKYQRYVVRHGVARLRFLAVLGVVLPLLGFAAIFLFVPEEPPQSWASLLMLVFGFTIILTLFALLWLAELQKDLVKYAIAKQQGWLYSPNGSKERWKILKEQFPELFKQGDHNQQLEDEWWGEVQGRHLKTPFWHGIFRYTVQTGDNTTELSQPVFAVKLEKPVSTDVLISPEGLGTKIKNVFTRTDVQLESNEFNQLFHISYPKGASDTVKKVFEVLNPALMAALLDLRQEHGPYSLLFRQDTAIIMFPSHKNFFHLKSNIMKSTEIHPDDLISIEKAVREILDISNDIAFRLD